MTARTISPVGDQVITSGSATPAEAAAIAVAIARFKNDHAPVIADAGPAISAWQRAALLEGTGRDPDAGSPWGDPMPWGV